MKLPLVIRVIGTPSAGKTLVIRMAMLELKRRGMTAAHLDVDRFMKAAVIADDGLTKTVEQRRESIKKTLSVLQRAVSRFMQPDGNKKLSMKTVSDIQLWMSDVQVDVVFLEHRWLEILAWYPADITWYVTSPFDERFRRLGQLHSKMLALRYTLGWFPGGILANVEHRWNMKTAQLMPKEFRTIYNDTFGRNALRYRIRGLLDESEKQIASRVDEMKRPTLPPASLE